MPRIDVNKVTLYYELHGPESSPLLVLNNGVIMNAATSWVYQTKVLAKHYRVLQYDCRGQGQSDHPDEAYSMETHADDLAALMHALDFQQGHIAGISYGGEIAQAFVLKYPSFVNSLILMDTVSEVQPELQIIAEGWIDALKTGNPHAFFNATVPLNFSSKFIRENPLILEDAKKRYADLDFPAIIRLVQCFLQVDFTGQLDEVEVPTCIVAGELDLLKGPVYARILKEAISHAELHIIYGAAHVTCWEKPEEINTIILGFLAKY